VSKRRNKNSRGRENFSYNEKKVIKNLNGHEIKSVVTTNFSKKSGDDGVKEVEVKKHPHKVVLNKAIFNKKAETKPTDKKNISSIIQKYFDSEKKKNEKIRVKRNRTIIPYKINSFQKEICPICNKIIVNMSQSIMHKEKNKPAHFDCVFEEAKKLFFLKQTERFAYMGSGIFAVIEDVKTEGKQKFVIKDKIQYIDKEKKIDR
jgi:hypothetical protein